MRPSGHQLGILFSATVLVDTPAELEYLRHGGILPFVVRRLASEEA